MKNATACNSLEHVTSRRQFLAGTATGVLTGLSFAGLAQPAATKQLEKAQKRVLPIWLDGGLSQLESWDPKPRTLLGGPFQAIPTSVTGVHISELLPYTAAQMHRITLIRSIEGGGADHHSEPLLAGRSRAERERLNYPFLGPAMAKWLEPEGLTLPGSISLGRGQGPASVTAQDAGFLGAKYGSIHLPGGALSGPFLCPGDLSEASDRQREEARKRLDERFARKHPAAEDFGRSCDKAFNLMQQRGVFDISREDPRYLDRYYGRGELGRLFLTARKLLEAGVPFVSVGDGGWDTHYDNFNIHKQKLAELDRPFAMLLTDLAERGLLESTLVIMMSEMGRHGINQNLGREHFVNAWSVAMAGCGLQSGAVVGKTTEDGVGIKDRRVRHTDLFATIFRAVGINPKKNYYVDGQPIPIAPPEAAVVEEILS